MSREDWKETTLGEVVLINPKVPKLQEDSPFIEMADVDTWGRWAFPSGPKGKRGGIRATGGDTLMARITPCLENGKIAQIPGDFGDVGGSTEFIVLRATDETTPEFVFLLAQGHRVHSESIGLMVGTSGRQRVSAKDVASIQVFLPPVEEQREIVSFMRALDLMIQAGDREIASAEQMRGDALKTVLTDRNSQWDQIPLREVATWKSGATPKAGTPEFYQGGTINWAKIGDIQNAPIYDTETKITEAGFEKIKKVAPVGSTLIAMYGASIGRSAFVMNEMATNQAILCGIPDEEVIAPEFLFLSALNLEDEFRRQGRGAAQPNINKTIIGDQKIPLPPLEEQEKIVEKMQTLDAYLESAKRSQEALKQVRQDALHALLSGDKDVRELAEMFATDEDVA